jgi:hypothetical protein
VQLVLLGLLILNVEDRAEFIWAIHLVKAASVVIPELLDVSCGVFDD